MFAAFHRFKKKRFGLSADFMISGEGRFEIRQKAAGDRDEVSQGGQFQKFIFPRLDVQTGS
jgi:hypothetical protein